MRMTIILASICAFLVSCSTLSGGGDDAQLEQTSIENSSESPSLDVNAPPALIPVGSGDSAYGGSHEMTDSQAPLETQAAEQQTAQVDSLNEQRSSSELDAAAPESNSSGTDSFYASGQAPVPEVEQVASPAPPTVLPEKTGASWDQHTETAASSYQEEEPMPVKKSKKISKSKKHDKKKITKNKKKSKALAKHSKKSKKAIAKHSKKSKKHLAKKSKYDCKKIAKNGKKASKREIASCNAEVKKASKSKKSHKTGKLAYAG